MPICNRPSLFLVERPFSPNQEPKIKPTTDLACLDAQLKMSKFIFVNDSTRVEQIPTASKLNDLAKKIFKQEKI